MSMRVVKQINRPMPMSELIAYSERLKFRLWQHIEERQEHQINREFVRYIEREIDIAEQQIAKAKAA